MRWQQPLLVTLALLLPATAALAQSRSVAESRPLAADGRVRLENMAGLIEISAWDQAEVNIAGELGADVEELEITSTPGDLKIRVRNRAGQRSIAPSELRLRVPRAASVEARGVSASISIEGLAGESLLLNTVSGDIEAIADAERLEAESVSGDIRYEGSAARVVVDSVSGGITLRGVPGEVRVSTVSGDLSLNGGPLTRGQFETVSGDLDIAAAVADKGLLRVESMSGDVGLVLPAGQQAEFSVQIYSGDLRSEFGPPAQEAPGPGIDWSHREGSGGATIRVESFSGDVRISRE